MYPDGLGQVEHVLSNISVFSLKFKKYTLDIKQISGIIKSVILLKPERLKHSMPQAYRLQTGEAAC